MHNIISEKILDTLRFYALQLRIDSVRATTASKSGHPTSCLSAADIVAALFFHQLRYNIQEPAYINNDRFILSKGHAVPIVYAAWKQLGVISDKELLSLRTFNSPLEGHPTPRFKYNEAATGSLGQGLSIGAGFALHAKKQNLDYVTYVLMGDGEIAEGSVWEAASFATQHKLTNLIGIVDVNELGQTGKTAFGHHTELYANRFEAFGWRTIVIDGHNMTEILEALVQAVESTTRPTMIIARTIKGYGLPSEAGKVGFHGVPIPEKHLDEAINELKKFFPVAAAYHVSKPPQLQKPSAAPTNNSCPKPTESFHSIFSEMELIAPRKAFGLGLAAVGAIYQNMIVLDADVKNSTFTEIFQQQFPSRFVECFVAEQNMIGVASGLALRGNLSVASTFGAFFTRAFDQIRMAAIGQIPLRLAGSHCGVSIGEDGPSQMGLEDISIMRSLPNSVVLYPSDGVSAYALCKTMAEYNGGISYIRTTRAQLPILYSGNEKFSIGGCKILRQSQQDVACVVAAGITLHEALHAYAILKSEQIAIAVIDAYSIKPLDAKTIANVAANAGHRLITVEDHYQAGGLGEAIASELYNEHFQHTLLCVKILPKSGSPSALLHAAGIDAQAIVQAVRKLLAQ